MHQAHLDSATSYCYFSGVQPRLSLQQLAGAAGVTPRTVRYYISEGLLPSPERGPGARYDPEQLARLRLIRQLQRSHLPLAEIRRRLHDLTDAEVRQLVAAAPQTTPPESALDYVRSVLEEPRAYRSLGPMPAAPSAPAPARRHAAAGPPPSVQPDRSHWDRVSLSPDVELHIRRPLTRGQNRAVSRLIGLARQILEEEQP
jgi:DNA-binding transcriptional MerR regulator